MWADRSRTETGSRTYGLFLPLALLSVALVGWFAFQAIQLRNERSVLKQVRTSQEAQVQQSVKARSALESLASDTARLAEQGNVNAKLMVEELRKRNITIKPNAKPTK